MIIDSEFWLAHLKFLKSRNSHSCFQSGPCSEGEMSHWKFISPEFSVTNLADDL